MALFNSIFDMSKVPVNDTQPENSIVKARFVKYMNRLIQSHAYDYYHRFVLPYAQVYRMDSQGFLNWEQNSAEQSKQLERIDTMVSVMKEFPRLKMGEQRVYICLYQLDWDVAKTAHMMECSESYVCRLNRSLITKLGLALKGRDDCGGV